MPPSIGNSHIVPSQCFSVRDTVIVPDRHRGRFTPPRRRPR
jgi:hypothetical protein